MAWTYQRRLFRRERERLYTCETETERKQFPKSSRVEDEGKERKTKDRRRRSWTHYWMWGMRKNNVILNLHLSLSPSILFVTLISPFAFHLSLLLQFLLLHHHLHSFPYLRSPSSTQEIQKVAKHSIISFSPWRFHHTPSSPTSASAAASGNQRQRRRRPVRNKFFFICQSFSHYSFLPAIALLLLLRLLYFYAPTFWEIQFFLAF